ncbi:hypothetical protein K435DRAFT_661737, partial [Dendrothele bispora CBS 962.96]
LKYGWDGALAILSDVITTVALSVSYNRYRTGIKSTETLLRKLLEYTVTRGLLVTLTQTGFVILYLAKPLTLWWMPFYLSLGKIYVITMGKG